MNNIAAFETLAALGGGIFSATSAAALGVGHDVLQRAVKQGTIVRLTRGWYTTRDRMRGSDEHRHRVRTRAVVASLGPEYVATHHSALLVYNLPTLNPDLRTVHVGSRRHKRIGGTKHYRRHVLPPATPFADTTPPAVSSAAAVVQVGLLEGPRAALVAADNALRRGRPDLLEGPIQFGNAAPEQLDQALAAYRRVPGKAAVECILRLVDPRAESPGETLLRYDLTLLRIAVEPQFEIKVGDHRYRADFRVKGTRILIEFDGLEKLNDPLERHRREQRESQLHAQGWRIVRFIWSELGNLDLIASRLAAKAAEMGMAWPVAA